MVASCCRFLCYFCRISRQNQKAMFDHLSYLLENSSVGLGGYRPLCLGVSCAVAIIILLDEVKRVEDELENEDIIVTVICEAVKEGPIQSLKPPLI